MTIRRESIEHGVPLFTSLDTIAAMLKVLESRSFVTQAI
jgi:carbamoyl-phosphate synthase large subunit